MLALGVRYLNGFAAACEHGARQPGRERAEWPPHPARVFMALAAAHFQTGAEPAERDALLWLERLPAPSLRAPGAAQRAVVTHYVPVNDKATWKKDPANPRQRPAPPLQSAPAIMRDRQDRTFARAWLEDDTVYLAWPDASPEDGIARALEGLCAKVTRIGHSMSLVQMWAAKPGEVGAPDWVPDDDRAAIRLRVPGPGTLEELERRYNREAVEAYAVLAVTAADDTDRKAQRAARKRLKEEFDDEPPPRLRPEVPFYQGYARPAPPEEKLEIPGSVFSPHLIVFTLEPQSGPYRALDLACAAAAAKRWREALVSHSNDLSVRAREVVSGHDSDGVPLQGPHLAFVPLAFVGHRHADGHLLGMALALPEGLGPGERRSVLRPSGRVDELKLGRLGVWRLRRDTSTRPPWNLRPEACTAHPEGATHWSTVTPVAFDRHPKAKDRGEYQREVAEMMAGACTAIRLPRPREVIVTPVSAHLGVPPAHAFPRLTRKDGSERRHAHAILVFDRAVRGPILIGAGRYRGYGVCRPITHYEV
jgi:CRISPR-associated protein Csb2